MTLRLLPPGARKGSASYIVKGWHEGRAIEKSLGTKDPKEAETRFLELQVELRRAKPATGFTFRDAIELYTANRTLTNQHKSWLRDLADELGTRDAATITNDDLWRVAVKLYPKAKVETRNRHVLTPAASVLHHAHYAGKVPWLRVRKFKEARPEPRSVSEDVERALLSATEGRQRLLLLLLFRQGRRITEVLRITWLHVDLKRGSLLVHNTKGNDWEPVPLNDEVAAALAAIPREERVGRVFPWGDRHNVYRWLRPLCRRLRVRFTPHMARHTFATEAVTRGDPMIPTMAAAGWKDAKSFQRYGRAEWKAMRAVVNRGKTEE